MWISLEWNKAINQLNFSGASVNVDGAVFSFHGGRADSYSQWRESDCG
jgi:hypothetical protein